jgi:hypothetical protein
MAELERDLRALGALVEYPPEPDLLPGVRAGLARPPRPAWRRRSRLVLVLAALALAVAVAFAVPPARSAILRFFHLGGVTVERVEELPQAPRRSPVSGLAGPMSLDRASRVAGFEIVRPSSSIDRAYAAQSIAAMLFRAKGVQGPVLLSELRGFDLMMKKVATEGTEIEPVTVNGHPGVWIEGAPHVVSYYDRFGSQRTRTTRLAGNVLIWTRGGFTFRLEGDLSRKQALHIARLVR